MELMQLEMFVAVVEEGSVRAAAERVFRTQPAVSIAIRKLEQETGAPVFDRSKRYQYQLTPVGDVLYSYATRMLRLRNEATFALGELCNVRSGRLRIGANESISLHFLPRLAEAFLKQYPSVSIEVKCERSASLLANLKDRNLEVALLSFRPKDKDLDAKIVAQDELVLITHPSHPSVGKRNVRIRDLSVEPLLGMDVSEPSPWHQKVADALVPFNTPLNLRIENAPIETIKKMVALGLGIAFVPLMSVGEERERGELAVIDVEDFHQERSVWLVRRRAVQSHAAKAFVEVAVRFGASAIPVRGLPQQETPDTKAARKVLMVRRG